MTQPSTPHARSTRLAPRLWRATLAAATAAALAIGPAAAQPMVMKPPTPPPAPTPSFAEIVGQVASMTGDGEMLSMAGSHGLGIINVLWEDTGRWEGSSVGPNISDVTIEVETGRDGGERQTMLMPVLRHDNFTDKTADVKLDRIFVPVGNQKKGGALTTISLRQLLANPGRYLSLPRDGKVKGGSLLAERDSHALVSAQHAFLPVPRAGKVNFWPVIFNYQSTAKNPAVLTILVTRQGTSVSIVDNQRDTLASSWGQRLYFNDGGQKAPLLAERLKDVQAKGSTANGESAASLGEDSNLLMLIQVPLKYRAPAYMAGGGGMDYEMAMDSLAPAPMAAPSAAMAGGGAKMATRGREADIDTAVLGHGPSEGKFTELDGLTIERDQRFPVRVTVQFYQATSTGVVTDADMAKMAAQIDKVYARGDYVGSLVVPGPRDRKRPTKWTGATPAPSTISIGEFPGLVERWGGWSRLFGE